MVLEVGVGGLVHASQPSLTLSMSVVIPGQYNVASAHSFILHTPWCTEGRELSTSVQSSAGIMIRRPYVGTRSTTIMVSLILL